MAYGARQEIMDILKNTPNEKKKIQWAFHTWFYAFRTLKFVHFCEGRYPGLPLLEAYAELFGMADFFFLKK